MLKTWFAIEDDSTADARFESASEFGLAEEYLSRLRKRMLPNTFQLSKGKSVAEIDILTCI